MKLEQKVVAVTGASSGLGRVLAKALAAAGCRVALLGRDRAALESLSVEIGGSGVTAVFIHDLKDQAAASGLVQQIEERLGPLSALIGNAGAGTSGLFADIPEAAFRESIEVNLLGQAALIRAALPGMLARREGAIVIVSSGVALRALPSHSAYSAAKAGLTALADALRVELDGSGISVVTVYPGKMATPFDSRAQHYGAPFAAPKEDGIPPEQIAERIVDAVRKGSPLVMTHGPAWAAGWLHRFAPGLVDRILAARLRAARRAGMTK